MWQVLAFLGGYGWLCMVVGVFGCLWVVVGGCCGWLQVFAYFSITHNGIHFNRISIFGQHCIGQWNDIFSLGLFHLWSLLSSTMKKTPKILRSCFRKKNIILYNIFFTKYRKEFLIISMNQLIWTTLHRLVIYSIFV